MGGERENAPERDTNNWAGLARAFSVRADPTLRLYIDGRSTKVIDEYAAKKLQIEGPPMEITYDGIFSADMEYPAKTDLVHQTPTLQTWSEFDANISTRGLDKVDVKVLEPYWIIREESEDPVIAASQAGRCVC